MIRGRNFRRRSSGPTDVALISVVFLLLIFFLITSSVSRPLDQRIQLVSINELGERVPTGVWVLSADGRVTRNSEADPDFGDVAAGAVAYLVPDRSAPAARLVELAARLQVAGASQVRILGEGDIR